MCTQIENHCAGSTLSLVQEGTFSPSRSLELEQELCQELVPGTFLAVQWLRLHLPMQEVPVRSLVRELRSHMPHGQKTKT